MSSHRFYHVSDFFCLFNSVHDVNHLDQFFKIVHSIRLVYEVDNVRSLVLAALIVHSDIGSLSRELDRNRLTDTSGATCDQSRFSI